MVKGKKFLFLVYFFVFSLHAMEDKSCKERAKKTSLCTALMHVRHHMIPIEKVEDLPKHLEKLLAHRSLKWGDVFGVWDIDDTVGKLDDLRPFYFDQNIELLQRLWPIFKQWANKDPFTLVMTDQRRFFDNSHMRPLDKANTVAAVIGFLKKYGPQIGVTARSTGVAAPTAKQVEQDLGIQFDSLRSVSRNSFDTFEFNVSAANKGNKKDMVNPPVAKAFAGGIVHCGINIKAEIVRKFLLACGRHPKILVVADDSGRNLSPFFETFPDTEIIVFHMKVPAPVDIEGFKKKLAAENIDMDETVSVAGEFHPRWQIYPSVLELVRNGPTGGSFANLPALMSPNSPSSPGPLSCEARIQNGDFFAS